VTYDPTAGDILERNEDAFDNLVVQGTTVEADLASHYTYSPERYRLFINGTRQFIQYDGNPTGFDDSGDTFDLTPQNSGDVWVYETAERFRYVVGYISEWSQALELNQSLGTDDSLIVGYGDADLNNSTDDQPGPAADGWFVIHDSADADNEAELAEYRDGTKVDSTDVTFTELFQTFGRLEGQTNWYNVGNTVLTETYTTGDGEQNNDVVGKVANNTGRGPTDGNQRFQVSLKVGNATSAGSLTAEVGSFGLKTLGEVTGVLRTKTFDVTETYNGTTGEFEPVLAIRIDPDRQNVTSELSVLEPLKFSATDDLIIIAQLFAPENVADSGGSQLVDGDFSTPNELSAQNSVIETSTAVDQVADSTGTLQTSMTDPGGYQLGYGSLTSEGAGGGNARTSSRARTQKRTVTAGDYVVVMIRSDSTGDLKFDIQFEQDW